MQIVDYYDPICYNISMYTMILDNLREWSRSTTERQKLQHVYLAVAAAMLVVAGVFGLANYTLGQQLLAIAIAAAGAFLVNAVAWALLQSFVLLRIEKPTSKPTTKKK